MLNNRDEDAILLICLPEFRGTTPTVRTAIELPSYKSVKLDIYIRNLKTGLLCSRNEGKKNIM